MNSPTRFSIFLLLALALARNGTAESLPDHRPALLGTHSRSLVNLINTDTLVKRGQKDGIVMFSCGVTEQGYGYFARAYRGSSNSEALRREVVDRIEQAQFEPAVFHHNHVGVYLSGTVMFGIHEGKPHLRIFLNQEEDDLKSGRDFIAPQFAFAPGNPKFKGIYYPPGNPGHKGTVSLHLAVDAEGHVESASIAYEYPPHMNFGQQAAGPIRDALFIPGFRNGNAVPCKFDWSFVFSGPGKQMRTG